MNVFRQKKAMFIIMKGKGVKNTENNIEVKSNVKPCYFQSDISHLNNHVSSLCNNGLHVDYKTSEKNTVSVIFINTLYVVWI